MNFLANSITALSLICGFASIIFSLESHFTFASWAIILAVVFDGFDGQIARISPSPSEFGKQLDSLVDVVSFGIAPAVLGYKFIYKDCCLWAPPVLFIYLLCSIMRLAKYNITPKEKMDNYFYGLPTTACGGILASFILIYRKKGLITCPNYLPYIFLFIVFVLSILMVSHIRYLNLDGLKQILGKHTELFVLFLIIILVLAAFLGKAGTTLFIFFLIYLLFSPFVIKRLNSQ